MRSPVALRFGAMLSSLLLLYHHKLVQCQSHDSSCDTFLAKGLGSTGSAMSEEIFTCDDGAYVTGVNIAYGHWTDALQIICSTGNESVWYGANDRLDELNISSVDTGGGLTSMSSFFNYHEFPCHVTFFAYTGEEEGSSSGSEQGPYGTCGKSYSSTSPTPDWCTVSGEYDGTSDCGSNAYAIGFSLRYYDYIYRMGLQCRGITATCPAPDGLTVPYTLPPTPSAPAEPTVRLGDDCSENACVEGLCCSDDRKCGATASFCRDGLCCESSDGSECTPGAIQCTIEEETEDQWYDNPVFIGMLTGVGIVITTGGASYAVALWKRSSSPAMSTIPDPREGLGGDCPENACVEGLCCSNDARSGATSFCSEGLCCRMPDKSDCAAGLYQCTIEEDPECYWYEDPLVIGTSTARGLIVMLGSGSYAVYR